MKELNPDLIKIVTTAVNEQDNFKIQKLLDGKNDLIAFCMGLKGKESRVIASRSGSRISYCHLGKKTADGQFSVEEMRKKLKNL